MSHKQEHLEFETLLHSISENETGKRINISARFVFPFCHVPILYKKNKGCAIELNYHR